MTHNPEFTSIECYVAYSDYEVWMKRTEELVAAIVKELHGSYKCKYVPAGCDEAVELDFSPPWKRYNMVETVEEKTGVKIPRAGLGAENEETRLVLEQLVQAVEKENGDGKPVCEEPRTSARLMDALCGHYVEDSISTKPGFVTEHPQIMSPLAKYHRSKPGLTERFEAFIMGKELCNAYTELNNPIRQAELFKAQVEAGKKGDEEAQEFDSGFIEALETGLPPTGGWGLGIDRLTMFLTNHNTIKEVILFPAMRPEVSQQQHHHQHKKQHTSGKMRLFKRIIHALVDFLIPV